MDHDNLRLHGAMCQRIAKAFVTGVTRRGGIERHLRITFTQLCQGLGKNRIVYVLVSQTKNHMIDLQVV